MKPGLAPTCARWLKFNLVGALGIGVQFGVLVLLTTTWHLGYSLATALAVEVAVLHNFVWHEKFTWIDKGSRHLREALRRFLWFDATTGVVSIGGNLLLMRLLVGYLHVRQVQANLLSISGCSVANVLVSDKCVFRYSRRNDPRSGGREHSVWYSNISGLRTYGRLAIPIRDSLPAGVLVCALTLRFYIGSVHGNESFC